MQAEVSPCGIAQATERSLVFVCHGKRLKRFQHRSDRSHLSSEKVNTASNWRTVLTHGLGLWGAREIVYCVQYAQIIDEEVIAMGSLKGVLSDLKFYVFSNERVQLGQLR